MSPFHRTPIVLSAVMFTLTLATIAAPSAADARGRGGVKKLAMKTFDVGSREVSVIATAKGSPQGAALVRLQNADVPTCYLLVLDSAPRKAKRIIKRFRARACAAYDKHAKRARLKRVQLTNRLHAWRVFIYSKRADALAKGAETIRLWALYSDNAAESKNVFTRVSTSFESKSNTAVVQSEICEAPSFPIGDEPTHLTLKCKNSARLESRITHKENSYRYTWRNGRFDIR